ncbi:unnamed protein product, partial [marine sediment metagenome]
AYGKALDFAGYTICRAQGRDSGADLGDEMSLLKGTITSGGSVKNWNSKCTDGSVLRFRIPTEILEKYKQNESDYWEIELK